PSARCARASVASGSTKSVRGAVTTRARSAAATCAGTPPRRRRCARHATKGRTMTENLASALAAFQLELPRLAKGNTADMGNYIIKYADLAGVSTVVLPLLAKHGLSFSAKPTLDEAGRFVLEYSLRHQSGES